MINVSSLPKNRVYSSGVISVRNCRSPAAGMTRVEGRSRLKSVVRIEAKWFRECSWLIYKVDSMPVLSSMILTKLLPDADAEISELPP
jgi:hypothetical protein